MEIKTINFKNVIVIILLLLFDKMHSQTYYQCYFNNDCDFIQIDTINKNNIWQIGTGNKLDKLPPYNQMVIITDTMDYYPIGTNSFFTLKIFISWMDYGTDLFFRHYYNTDKNRDGGIIKVSYNGGIDWFNLINDTLYYHNFITNLYTVDDTLFNGATGFSGIIDQWETVYYTWDWLYSKTDKPDSILLKFEFISDSIANNHYGWAIDGFEIMGYFDSSVDDYLSNGVKIYPNPIRDFMTIIIDKDVQIREVNIYSLNGDLINKYLVDGNEYSININMNDFISTFYLVQVISSKGNSLINKIIKLE